MPVGWFIVDYKRRENGYHGLPYRYCGMDDFTTLIEADGGRWREAECLGNKAIVKVRASLTTLQTIAGTAGFQRLPKDLLDDPLSTLTNAQKTALRDLVLSLGYTSQEITDALGNDIGSHTLRDVLVFMAHRRIACRYDSVNDSFVFDGQDLPAESIDAVDLSVN